MSPSENPICERQKSPKKVTVKYIVAWVNNAKASEESSGVLSFIMMLSTRTSKAPKLPGAAGKAEAAAAQDKTKIEPGYPREIPKALAPAQ